MALNKKVGHGSLGKSRKQSDNGGPTHVGSLTFTEPVEAGEKVWLSSWVKTGDDGTKFFSINVEKPQQQQREVQRPPVRQPARPSHDIMDDEIPF